MYFFPYDSVRWLHLGNMANERLPSDASVFSEDIQGKILGSSWITNTGRCQISLDAQPLRAIMAPALGVLTMDFQAALTLGRRYLAGQACVMCLLALAPMPAARAQTPSFDCTKASQPIERLICGDSGLSMLDTQLNETFRQAQNRLASDDRNHLLTDQRQWLRARVETCGLRSNPPDDQARDSALTCLRSNYQERIATLRGWSSPSAHAQTPDLECTNATQPAEHLVCEIPYLAHLNAEMGKLYERALIDAGSDRENLLKEQQDWLRSRSEVCDLSYFGDKNFDFNDARRCLGTMYEMRIEELKMPRNLHCSKIAANFQSVHPKESYPKEDHDIFEISKYNAKSVLNKQFSASKGLIDSLLEMADYYGSLTIDRLKNSDIYMVEGMDGTAHCQNLKFFKAKSGSKFEYTDSPSRAERGVWDENTEPGEALCYGAIGYMGKVSGAPAFIVHEGDVKKNKYSITLWHDGKWGVECLVDAPSSEETPARPR